MYNANDDFTKIKNTHITLYINIAIIIAHFCSTKQILQNLVNIHKNVENY